MYNFEEVIPGKLTRSWYVWKAVFFLLFALSALAKVAWIIRNNHELVLLDVVLLTILAGLLWASSQVFTDSTHAPAGPERKPPTTNH